MPRLKSRLLSVSAAALLVSGCGDKTNKDVRRVSDPPTVRLVHAEPRTIVREIGQPSFIQAYEHTSIYAKLPSYIEKWNVDIGDRVKKDQVLATLFMPELVEEQSTKKGDVDVAKEVLAQALKLDEVAKANVEAATAHLAETESILEKYQAEVDRWDSEVKRLRKEAAGGVVARQILDESTNQLRSNTAAREAAKSTIATAKADLLSRQAEEGKARVDIGLAKAKLAVAESEKKRLDALVGYLTLISPFDGVIVGRNANTGDFLLPNTGDPTARGMSPYQSPGKAAPVYEVDRTDVVRVFVDIPEADANYVTKDTKASVLARAFRDKEIPAKVTRTSWALNVKSRTLRAEVDLPNSDGQILPGMYAYGKVIIERPGVRALPVSALVYSGQSVYCWIYRDGKASRIEIETGASDGEWIEVTNHREKDTSSANPPPWIPFDGKEDVILGDLAILADGETVRIEKKTADAEVAKRNP